MSKNPHLPQLFREIFSGALLKFNDPRTLRLFLKEMDKFLHGENDDLGDAYEYLLSIMSSQGGLGQFRTPRHIIDFIVQLVNPGKDDRIIDPACGTSGFLIAAYKHILATHNGSDTAHPLPKLTATELDKLHRNFRGFDIDPTMIRTARVNMYLHGFKTPDIIEHDTLTSEDFWNEKYDVILANPPFMTPKGGIQPHRKFSLQANRSEALFTDYIATHLKPKGRAGFIVPEGIIFQTGNAYKQLRKNLVEQNGLVAVISLPGGVFQPYSGVKTSILYLHPELAKQRDDILFIKIENDGFSLGAQRRPIDANDLPNALQAITNYENNPLQILKGCRDSGGVVYTVNKTEIAKNGDYNLSGDRYRIAETNVSKYEMVELGEVLDYEQPTKYIVESVDYSNDYKTPVLTAGKTFILGKTNETEGIFPVHKLPVIIFDDFTTACKFVDFPFKVKSSAMKILHAKENVDIRFVYEVMKLIKYEPQEHKRFWISEFSKKKIPLPPLSVQREIVSKIAQYEKIIVGAKQVIDNYKPQIDINPNWEMVELGEVVNFQRGTSIVKASVKQGNIPVIAGGQTPAYYHNEANRKGETIAVSSSGAYAGFISYWDIPVFLSDSFSVTPKNENLNTKFLYFVLKTLQNDIYQLQKGVGIPHVYGKDLAKIQIPLPPLSDQESIVSQIEKEQSLVNANRELITLMERRINNTLAEVWQEG